LSLGTNNFSGTVPASYWTLPNLQFLVLEVNRLEGEIPPVVANLKRLIGLDLEYNRFSGPLPPALGELSELKFLHLTSNEFSGEIPCALGYLVNLTSLGLSQNRLAGAIPEGLRYLSNLTALGLGSNQLGGSIPEWLGALTGLKTLVLHNNRFVGPPPRNLLSLFRLEQINLAGNSLLTAVEPDLRQFLDSRHPRGTNWAASQSREAEIFPNSAADAAQAGPFVDSAGLSSKSIVGLVLWLLELDNRLEDTWIYFKIRSSPFWGSRITIRIKRRRPKPPACSANAVALAKAGAADLGNADLYVRRGSLPTRTQFDQASRDTGSDEEIVLDLSEPGTHFVGVHAREAFAGLELQIEFPDGSTLECIPDETTLCLNRGRFAVETSWFTQDGGSGLGRAHQLTEDTGYFWFFNPANVETVVKVLDACSFSDRFWVFAAGLTNVEVEMTVRDVETGERQIYRNPQGIPFRPVQDTAAFASCGASPPATPPARVAIPQTEGGCGDPSSLCVQDGRFRIQIGWRTPQGEEGYGIAQTLTEDTGYFWFFNEANIEALVKVLDGCLINNQFWVFAAGLTNVATTLTIEDLQTRERVAYETAGGSPFAPIQDTSAFSGCPSNRSSPHP
jgi:hypothetical protein